MTSPCFDGRGRDAVRNLGKVGATCATFGPCLSRFVHPNQLKLLKKKSYLKIYMQEVIGSIPVGPTTFQMT